MYQITRTEYGSRIIFSGVLTESEANQFAADVVELRATVPSPRSVILDLRELVPPEPGVLGIITRAMLEGADNGPQRAAVIVSSPVIRGQAVQIGFLTSVFEITRFIDANKYENWEELSLNWVKHGIEPELGGNPVKMNMPSL